MPCPRTRHARTLFPATAASGSKFCRSTLRSREQGNFGPIWACLAGKPPIARESAAQIPNSARNALTLTPVTSQSNDAHWQRPGESPEPTPGRPASARLVDPEDDLTPVGYPGDFETPSTGTTTATPRRRRAVRASARVTTCSTSRSRCPMSSRSRRPARGRRARRDRRGRDPTTATRRRPARNPASGFADIAGRARSGAGRPRVAEAVRLVGRLRGGRVQELTVRRRLPARRHPRLRAAPAARSLAGVLLVLGLFTPVAAAGALAFLINGVLAGISAQHHPHPSRTSCRRGTNTRSP